MFEVYLEAYSMYVILKSEKNEEHFKNWPQNCPNVEVVTVYFHLLYYSWYYK